MSYVIEFCAFHDFIFYRKSLHYAYGMALALIGLALLTSQRIRNVLFKLPWSTKFSTLVIRHTSPISYNITLQDPRVHPLVRDTTFHLALELFASLRPKTWNSLPLHIRQSQTYSSFRRHLKTYSISLSLFWPLAAPLMRPDSLLRL